MEQPSLLRQGFGRQALLSLLRERDPASPAIVCEGKTLSIGELLRDTELLAEGFQQAGMKAGDTAVLAAMPDAGFVCIVYAAMICGLRLAVIDPEMGRDNYREKLKQLQPQWAFVDYRLLFLQEHPLIRWAYFQGSKKGIYFPRSPGVKTIATGGWMPIFQKHIPFGKLMARNSSDDFKSQGAPQLEERDFLITYTSGTTSMPKGVVHSVGAITASILQIADLIRGGHNRRIATHLPYFAIIGLNAGVTAYLWEYRLSATGQIDFIEKNQITTLFSPPCDYLRLIEYCEREGKFFPECLQHLFFGSAPVHRSFLERLMAVLPEHVRLTCLYGMTENLVVASIDGREKAMLPTASGDILGRPVPGVEIQIAADGEILVRSPQTYTRYLHFDKRDDWHASGDLGFLDSEGRIVLTGRKKDMIIRRNFNLYPGLYEPTINRIPGVTECAFVGVFDETKHDETVALFVETHRPVSETAFKKQLERGEFSIDREALPDLIFFEKLPRAGRQNKVDKNALRERLRQSFPKV
ncbi:MAG: class I adenylate-forming enzyme family protein [Saprospiraceae bacterium]